MESNDYQFKTGENIDSFINEIQQPKEHFVDDPFAGLEKIDEENAAAEEAEYAEMSEEKIDTRMKPQAARAGGAMVTAVIDTVIPAILGIIAKEDAKNYKADEMQRAELEEAVSAYMELKGDDIPPGVSILILILGVYGAQVPVAIQHRKLNEREEELQKREKELQQREEELRRQSAASKSKEKVNKEEESAA